MRSEDSLLRLAKWSRGGDPFQGQFCGGEDLLGPHTGPIWLQKPDGLMSIFPETEQACAAGDLKPGFQAPRL